MTSVAILAIREYIEQRTVNRPTVREHLSDQAFAGYEIGVEEAIVYAQAWLADLERGA